MGRRVNQHRSQTSYVTDTGRNFVARRGWQGGYDVLEVTAAGSRLIDHHTARAVAERHAALAAGANPGPLFNPDDAARLHLDHTAQPEEGRHG